MPCSPQASKLQSVKDAAVRSYARTPHLRARRVQPLNAGAAFPHTLTASSPLHLLQYSSCHVHIIRVHVTALMTTSTKSIDFYEKECAYLLKGCMHISWRVGSQ